MGIHMLCTVVLCVTLLSSACLSAIVSPWERSVSEEYRFNKSLATNLIFGNNEENTDTRKQKELQSTENTEDSRSEEKIIIEDSIYNSFSSESSKEEKNENKKIQKRSLDTDQDSLNKMNEEQTQTEENKIKFNIDSSPETVSVTYDDTTTTVENKAEVTPFTEIRDLLPSEITTTAIDPTSETVVVTSEIVSEASESKDISPSTGENDAESLGITKPSGEIESTTSENEEGFTEMALARADKLSEQIRKILTHYRKEGVVVLPGKSFFPEPMVVQDFEKSFSIGVVDFKNMTVYGLSNFTVEHINTDVDQMQVYILLHMRQLIVLGNYSLRTFWSRSAGPFNVTLLNVSSEGVAAIETTQEGHLEASDSEMDMLNEQMIVDFKGLGTLLQSMLNTVGNAMFDSIKPQILDRVNQVIRKDVNEKLKEFSVKFVNKVAPVDLAFSEGRTYVREHGYDPLNIKQHTFLVGGIVNINISEFTVNGLSKFNRVGNLSLSMDAGIIQFGVHVLTRKLTGDFNWSGGAFGIARHGKTNFTIDHLQVRAIVNQSLDVRQKPQLEQLDLQLGWLKVTMDSPMTLNMMVEGIINAFPRLIKHMIVDALEMPLKEKIQEILNQINVESFVDSNLPRLDSFGL